MREARLDGTYVSSFATPSYYGVADPALGIRRNLAFESLIAVERSFSAGLGNGIKLYLTSLTGATDLIGRAIAPTSATFMQKQLLLDLTTLGVTLDHVEGITWGPLVNGRHSLVLVSDNNFSATQVTQFLAFEVTAVPEPQTCALMLGGLGLVGWIARRCRAPR